MGSKWVELLREMAPVDQKKRWFSDSRWSWKPTQASPSTRTSPASSYSGKVALGFTLHFQHIRSSEEHKKYNLWLVLGSSLFVLPFPLLPGALFNQACQGFINIRPILQ